MSRKGELNFTTFFSDRVRCKGKSGKRKRGNWRILAPDSNLEYTYCALHRCKFCCFRHRRMRETESEHECVCVCVWGRQRERERKETSYMSSYIEKESERASDDLLSSECPSIVQYCSPASKRWNEMKSFEFFIFVKVTWAIVAAQRWSMCLDTKSLRVQILPVFLHIFVLFPLIHLLHLSKALIQVSQGVHIYFWGQINEYLALMPWGTTDTMGTEQKYRTNFGPVYMTTRWAQWVDVVHWTTWNS